MISGKNLDCRIPVYFYRRHLPRLVNGGIFLIFFTYSLYAQESSTIYPFGVGEYVKYDAYYNWKFIWLSAGTAEFHVADTLFEGIPSFHFKSGGRSHSNYDWFFKVRERFESIAQKVDLAPLWFVRDSYEGGYKAFNRYSYRYADSALIVDSYTSERPYRQKKLKIEKRTYDVLSAIYYCRTIDFGKLTKGECVPLAMAIDDGIYDLFIRYLGTEKIKHRNGQLVDTYKFSVMLVEGTIFRGGEDMLVWVSTDNRKIPIVVEAKILVGSVKAYLADYRFVR